MVGPTAVARDRSWLTLKLSCSVCVHCIDFRESRSIGLNYLPESYPYIQLCDSIACKQKSHDCSV